MFKIYVVAKSTFQNRNKYHLFDKVRLGRFVVWVVFLPIPVCSLHIYIGAAANSSWASGPLQPDYCCLFSKSINPYRNYP